MHANNDLDPARRYLCRHVHTDGRRCGSPALRAQNFCYYHDRARLQNAPLAGRAGIFRMQPIDDRAAIQIALYDVLSRLTAGDLDNKRASILLYGLQIASSNLARLHQLQPATQPIEDITTHHQLGDLAPITEITEEQPPHRLLCVTKGEEGGKASMLTATSEIVLSEGDNKSTAIRCSSEVAVVGRLGKFGLGIMKKQAGRLAAEFARAVQQRMQSAHA